MVAGYFQHTLKNMGRIKIVIIFPLKLWVSRLVIDYASFQVAFLKYPSHSHIALEST